MQTAADCCPLGSVSIPSFQSEKAKSKLTQSSTAAEGVPVFVFMCKLVEDFPRYFSCLEKRKLLDVIADMLAFDCIQYCSCICFNRCVLSSNSSAHCCCSLADSSLGMRVVCDIPAIGPL